MRLALKEAPPLQPAADADAGHDAGYAERFEHADGWVNLMTPARRAALDALEREFHELVVLGILKTAGR
ncbi:MAG TPA: hypothetical protein VNR39_13760 [Pseudolabrys sp.]|nr:hypothetical protein [Pseudolabrys sp.]